MKITVVVDNNAGNGLDGELGLSLWVQTPSTHLLFDTGQGRVLPRNARELGVELERADALVLSHGHYDHSGGIGYVLDLAKDARLYCHPNVVVPRYNIREGTAKPISMPQQSLLAIEKIRTKRLQWTASPAWITKSIGVTGAIPRSAGYEDTGGSFYLDTQGQKVDWIEDDQAMFIQTREGLVVCLGCAHAGVINTLHYVSALTGVSHIHAIIGGLHLQAASDQRLEQTIAALHLLAPDKIIVAHCTGKRGLEALSGAFGRKVQCAYTGATYDF